VFRGIPRPFETTKTCGGLNVSKTVAFVDENRKKEMRKELVSNRRNKIQNGRHVNKGKMQRITISSGPCGKLVSTKWGVSELEVDYIMFY